MAFRLDKAIVRGEISNEQRGTVTGRIWILGRKEPLQLELKGNCLRDLAGCVLRFENPAPRRDQLIDLLESVQRGNVGDMTASRKAKVPTVSEEEMVRLLRAKQQIPCVLANKLYLEWFSESNGRVVVESDVYKLNVSQPAWSMTAEEEKRQSVQSQENFYQLLDQMTGNSSIDDDDEEFAESEEELEEEDVENVWETGEEKPLDEFEWEQELREADRRAEAYQEAFDRYKDHPDRERLIAEAMGWEMEESDEFKGEGEDATEEAAENDFTEEELPDDAEESHHPLSKRAMKFALHLQEDAEARGLLGSEKTSRDTPLLSVIVSIISLGGKLAAALDGSYEPEPGFVIAMLKRAQIPLNEAMHALSAINMESLGKDTQMWLATARSELFDLRKDILDLMKELRQR